MSSKRNARKNADDTSKAAKALILSIRQLRNLDNQQVTEAVAALLTKVDGALIHTFRGNSSDTKVLVTENSGESTNVTVDELIRVLQAPGHVKQILKRRKVLLDAGGIQNLISNYLFAFDVKPEVLKPIRSEILGRIKQSLSIMRKVEKNIQIADNLEADHDDDPFKPYICKVLKLVLQIVAEGIVNLCTGQKTVAQSNIDGLAKYKVPIWCFNRFTREALRKDATPYSILFPRKKHKGITCSTSELLDSDFVQSNSVVLSQSKLLLGILKDFTLLNYTINLEEQIDQDEAKEAVFKKHNWNVLPPLCGGVDVFLAEKARGTAEILPDIRDGNLKSQLAKIGNALLRTSLLENSGMKPDTMIGQKLCPNSVTDFHPSSGSSIYELLRAEIGIEDAVLDYFNVTGQAQAKHWAELLCLELKVQLTDEVLHSMCRIFQVDSVQKLLLIHPSKVDPSVDNKIHPGEEPGSSLFPMNLTKMLGYGGSVTEHGEFDPGDKIWIYRMKPRKKTGLKISTEKLDDSVIGKFDYLRESSDSQKVSGFQKEVTDIKEKTFPSTTKKSGGTTGGDRRNKGRPVAMSTLTSVGRNLKTKIAKKLGEDAGIEIEDYLRRFSSKRLQLEALKRIAGAMEQGFQDFLDSPDENDLLDDEDDGTVEDDMFNLN